MMKKKGQIDGLVGLGYGLIVLAIMIGVGLVVLQNFSQAASQCASGFSYNSTPTPNVCSNGTDSMALGTASTTTNTLMTYLGTGSGGLVTWVPAIIALVIGMYFIGAFRGSGGRKV
jgi:hypothetical protein